MEVLLCCKPSHPHSFQAVSDFVVQYLILLHSKSLGKLLSGYIFYCNWIELQAHLLVGGVCLSTSLLRSRFPPGNIALGILFKHLWSVYFGFEDDLKHHTQSSKRIPWRSCANFAQLSDTYLNRTSRQERCEELRLSYLGWTRPHLAWYHRYISILEYLVPARPDASDYLSVVPPNHNYITLPKHLKDAARQIYIWSHYEHLCSVWGHNASQCHVQLGVLRAMHATGSA